MVPGSGMVAVETVDLRKSPVVLDLTSGLRRPGRSRYPSLTLHVDQQHFDTAQVAEHTEIVLAQVERIRAALGTPKVDQASLNLSFRDRTRNISSSAYTV